MAPFPVIENLDVFEQIGLRLVPRLIANPVNPLSLEHAEEALDDRIVITIAHAACDPVLGQFLAAIVAGVLAAAVRVMDQHAGWPASRNGHPQRVEM